MAVATAADRTHQLATLNDGTVTPSDCRQIGTGSGLTTGEEDEGNL